MFFDNLVIDSCYSHAFYAYADGTGVIASLDFDGCWFSAVSSTGMTESFCMELTADTATCVIGLVSMSRTTFNGGKTDGLRLKGRIRGFNSNGGRTVTYETAASGKAGVRIDNTQARMKEIALRNMSIEGQNETLTAFTADYGVNIIGATPIVGLAITDNGIGGDTTSVVVPAYAVGELTSLIGNNQLIGTGTKYNGNKTGTAPFTLPVSGVAWTNTTPFRVEVAVGGGTVTGVSKNGVGLAGLTSIVTVLEPGESLTVTYSSAPTMIFLVRT